MNDRLKKITVLVPCYNEEKGIGNVVTGFPVDELRKRGFLLEVVVIDNNSKDRTTEVAEAAGATVLFEGKKGKGHAIRKGMYSIGEDTDYVVMLDGDNTYKAKEIMRLIEPLHSGFCDVAIGTRLCGYILPGSMRPLNKLGNRIFTRLVRMFYRVPATDVLTGYYAWKRETIERLRPHLTSFGFTIEMEMMTKMARLKERICSVPITYEVRSGDTNLRILSDGSAILLTLFRNIFWKPKREQRIAFVSDAVLPWHNGGKERRLYEIARRLTRTGKEVHIYTMNWWGGSGAIVHEGIHYHALCDRYPLYVDNRRSLKQAIIFGVSVFKLLFKKFDILDVDHIPFFPLYSARIVTWLKGKKLYATWHEVWGRAYWRQYAKGFVGFVGNIMERISYWLPDVIISNSKHTTSRLHAVGMKKKVRTIPLGIDVKDIFEAEPAVEKSDIIFIGRLLSHKNVDLLIKAISIVKKAHPAIVCRIIGSGPEEDNIKKLVHTLKLRSNVYLHHAFNDHVKYGFMKAAKMLVLPSVREGFGLVVLEANAAGIPVITTSHHNNAAKDLIQEGVNGLLTEANEEGIAERITQLMRGGNRMKPRQGIEQYDWQIVVENLRQVFV
jgi:glycosyltransferase involved in cell wall biosynthesis